jgi:predicted phosphodiesterase
MAKIWIMSDMHCEFGVPAFTAGAQCPPEADLVLIAGDFHNWSRAVQVARENFPRYPILMICGNHEFYGLRMPIDASIDYMRAAAMADRGNNGSETYVLENESIELKLKGDHVRVIGATLWTDFKIFNDYKKYSSVAEYRMNDYSSIRGRDGGVLTPNETAQRFSESYEYIKTELEKPFEGKTIVVTHHLPSMRSVADRYKTDPLTPAFVSNCEPLMDLGANLWVHGHSHDSSEYSHGRTRVVCNPRGYPYGRGAAMKFENKEFDPVKVVEI